MIISRGSSRTFAERVFRRWPANFEIPVDESVLPFSKVVKILFFFSKTKVSSLRRLFETIAARFSSLPFYRTLNVEVWSLKFEEWNDEIIIVSASLNFEFRKWKCPYFYYISRKVASIFRWSTIRSIFKRESLRERKREKKKITNF